MRPPRLSTSPALLTFALLCGCSEARIPLDSGDPMGWDTAVSGLQSAGEGIIINELLADSSSGPDWIELFNPTAQAIALDGYALTDAVGESPGWALPAGRVLAPGAHLLVWADAEDSTADAQDGALHATFKLSKEGEAVALLHPDGGLADQVVLPASDTDQSWGRAGDGALSWNHFRPPTPAAPNPQPDATSP